MLHGVRHALTPGTPVYGALKFGALGSVFLLQRTVRKRAHAKAEEERLERERQVAEVRRAAREAHPRSKKKKRRRR